MDSERFSLPPSPFQPPAPGLEIADTLTIDAKTEGSRRSTLADVARLAGVTKGAASFAFSGKRKISEKTRERVFAAALELDYHPNPNALRLSTGIAHNVVGLFSLTLDHMGWQSMSHIHNALTEKGYEAPLHSYGYAVQTVPDYRPLLETLCRQLPHGLICNSFRLDTAANRQLAEYQKQGGTVVVLHSPLDLECDQVLFDRSANTYLAAQCLLEAGHRKIGLCTFSAADKSTPRTRGFMNALQAYDAPVNASWLYESGRDEAGGARLAQEFLAQSDRPTGLCIVNDMQAAAFVHQILRAGLRVPEDVSVVALDGLPASLYGMIKITTVTQPWAEMADKSVEFLTQRLEGTYDGEARQQVFTGEVIARDSVRNL